MRQIATSAVCQDPQYDGSFDECELSALKAARSELSALRVTAEKASAAEKAATEKMVECEVQLQIFKRSQPEQLEMKKQCTDAASRIAELEAELHGTVQKVAELEAVNLELQMHVQPSTKETDLEVSLKEKEDWIESLKASHAELESVMGKDLEAAKWRIIEL